jgi:hypothetical protein
LEKGKWKYLEIFGNKKNPKKTLIVIKILILLPLSRYFYLYSLCKMTAWKYLEIKNPKKPQKTPKNP